MTLQRQSPLVVNVTDLLELPGSRKELTLEQPVPELGNELVRVRSDEPLRFDLSLEAIDEGAILVRGRIRGTYDASCRRCLDEIRLPFMVSAAEVYRPPSAGVWEEGYAIVDESIDLEPMVRDNVLLEMPMYPVCAEDCAGLCARCGGNRNRGECTCTDEQADDRWGALRELLKDSEA